MSTYTEVPRASRLRLAVIGKIANFPDSWFKRGLKAIGANRLLPFLVNKYYSELSFQKRWARVFQNEREKVREYWKRYRHLDDIFRICALDENSVILDVGCGISTVLHFVPGHRFGIDPLADEYKKVYAYPDGIDVRKGFGEEIPFPDQYFTTAFCSNVIDHTTDPEKTVNEIVRVLKPGGFFVLTVELFEEHEERDLSHPHSLTEQDVRRLVAEKFDTVFDRTASWMHLIDYVQGSNKTRGEQLILILRKR